VLSIRISSAVLFSLMAAGALGAQQAPTQPPDDECAVWTATISYVYPDSQTNLILVRDSTTLGLVSAAFNAWSGYPKSLKDQGLDVSQADLDDLKTANAHRTPVRLCANLGRSCRLLSDAELKALFGELDHRGWTRFKTAFPTARGFVNVSRPRFNGDRTQALVYAGTQVDWLNGEGQLILLKREGGTWVVRTHALVWIS